MNEKYYKTTSFYLASFLFASGCELVNIDKTTNPRRSSFVFANRPELQDHIQQYNYSPEGASEVQVDARKFVVAIKTLKEKLYQDT